MTASTTAIPYNLTAMPPKPDDSKDAAIYRSVMVSRGVPVTKSCMR